MARRAGGRGWACLLAVSLAFAGTARADALDEVKRAGVLRWGGDQEGGGPYIFPDAADADKLTGFEVELMARLAERLAARAEFVQGEWDSLPDLLKQGGIQVICNGYELTPDRLDVMISTIPYYIYELQMLVRDDSAIRAWDDLTGPDAKPARVSVLSNSAASKYLTGLKLPHLTVVDYKGNVEAMEAVANGQADATLQDVPIVAFNKQNFPRLRLVGEPVAPGYYVLLLRPGDERLRDALNDGIRGMLADGSLKALYGRYGLWNRAQERLVTPEVQSAPESMKRAGPPPTGWEVVARNALTLLRAAGVTVLLSVVSMPLAVVIGLAVALIRLDGPAPLGWLGAVYVEVVRGTPLLLQLFVIYYVVPTVVPLPAWLLAWYAFPAGVLGLAINYSAYEAEIYRAGLLAIPPGQTEAALALGMTRGQALRHIVVPQAVRLVIPPVTNDFIALFKDTAVCSVITVTELTKQYSILRTNNPVAALELAAVVGLLYLLMSYPLSVLARRLERQLPRI